MVTEVSLDVTDVSIEANDTIRLLAEILPINATNKTLEWSSSDESVATVDENGLVTAIAAGNTVITVKSKDGNAEATCNVVIYFSNEGIDYVSDDSNIQVEVFNLHGYKVADSIKNLTRGIYIVKKNNNTYKISVK